MTKNRKSLLGSAMAGALGIALLCGASAAQAQGYRSYDAYYGDNDAYYGDRGETVIVRPPYLRFDTPQSRTFVGHMDGQVNPTTVSMSHPVSFSDLDLTQRADFNRLRARVRNTAIGMCNALNDGFPDISESTDHRTCVRDAIRDAMAQVPERPVG